jgi:hypothetical protein
LWLNDQILLCANCSGDVISVLAASAESAITERKDFEHRDSPYVAMQRHKRVFIAASESGYLTVFDAATNPSQFLATRCVKLFGDELPILVHMIATDPSEENAIVSLENNRLVSVSLPTGDFRLNKE